MSHVREATLIALLVAGVVGLAPQHAHHFVSDAVHATASGRSLAQHRNDAPRIANRRPVVVARQGPFGPNG